MRKTCCCEWCKHPKQRHPVDPKTNRRGACDYPTCDCKVFL